MNKSLEFITDLGQVRAILTVSSDLGVSVELFDDDNADGYGLREFSEVEIAAIREVLDDLLQGGVGL